MEIWLGAFENAIPKSSAYPGLLAEFRQHLSRGAAFPAMAVAGLAWWGLARWLHTTTCDPAAARAETNGSGRSRHGRWGGCSLPPSHGLFCSAGLKVAERAHALARKLSASANNQNVYGTPTLYTSRE
jgi:hypothetical protein